jgi:hypothetical protein
MSCHMAALRVAQRTGLPWIMDMRDPWNSAMDYPLGLQRRHFLGVEQACVAAAARVINVNDQLTARHRQENPDQPAGKFLTLRNGVDADDFAGLPAAPAGPPLRLAYVGNLYGGRSALPLVEAVGRLHQGGVLTHQDLHVTLMGTGTSQLQGPVDALGVGSFFTLQPRMPSEVALVALSTSHVALLFFGDVDSTAAPTATKVYEACFLKKPALAVLPRGPLWTTLEAAGAVCAEPGDAAGLADVLGDLVSRFASRGELPRPIWTSDAAGAHRRAQAGQLAVALNGIPARETHA